MTTAEQDRTASDGIEMKNHRLVVDGSVWLCMHCKRTWPYPQPMPTPVTSCVPRRWG